MARKKISFAFFGEETPPKKPKLVSKEKKIALEVVDTPTIVPKVYQNEVKVDDLPMHPLLKKRLQAKIMYLFPNQVEAASSIYQIPISKKLAVSNFPIIEVDHEHVVLDHVFNLLVTTTTSSGKTLVGIFSIDYYLQHTDIANAIVVYVVPMKALGSEKFEEFSKLFDGIYALQLIMGGEQRFASKNHDKHIIITTYEKLDQLLRTQREELVPRIVNIIFDEFHMVGTDRGQKIEETVARLLNKVPILALSATISNDAEIAQWLRAKVIKTAFRPVPLKCGFITEDAVIICDHYGNPEVVDDTLVKKFSDTPKIKNALEGFMLQKFVAKESVLYFRQSRTNVEAFTKRMQYLVEKKCDIVPNTLLELPNKSGPTNKILQNCLPFGIAFHHAGLTSENRSYVEHNFENRMIRQVGATPTLAIGVNLPARWVVIDPMAYRNGSMNEIPLVEIRQMIGRAGRPQYDTEGYALINVSSINSIEEREHLYNHFFNETAEPLQSQFKSLEDLQMSILGNIAGHFATTAVDLIAIYKNTLAFRQNPDFANLIMENLLTILNDMTKSTPPLLLKEGKNYIATEFGLITNELYVHPRVALYMSRFVRKFPSKKLHPINIVYFLFHRCGLYGVPKRKTDTLALSSAFEKLDEHNIVLDDDVSYDQIDENAWKTTCVLIGDKIYEPIWANESTNLDQFYEINQITDGDIERAVGYGGNFNWILHAFRRIARYHRNTILLDYLNVIETRLEYGISDRLVDLCRIRNIGRERSRALYNAGFTTVIQVSDANIDDIAKIIINGNQLGEKLAHAIIEDARKLVEKKAKK